MERIKGLCYALKSIIDLRRNNIHLCTNKLHTSPELNDYSIICIKHLNHNIYNTMVFKTNKNHF